MSEPVITIIGGGLSTIYSYFGCIDAGYKPHEIEVLFPQIESVVGAIFMYESAIPWPPTTVVSILFGTCDGYAINQWGYSRETSVNKRFAEGGFPVIAEKLYMYEEMKTTLWGMIPNKKQVPALPPETIDSIKKTRKAVICTFSSKKTKIDYEDSGYLTRIPIHINRQTTDKHVVIYNGLPEIPWVRQTTIPGKIFTEYSLDSSPNAILAAEEVRGNFGGELKWSPDLDPECPPLTWDERIEGNLIRVGRFASFTPGYLSHMAQQDTRKFLSQL